MKKLNNIIIIFAIVLISNTLNGQVGINTPNPNKESLLELSSTDKGFLPVRLSLVSMTSAAPLSQHVKGMVVYNTANTSSVSEGLYVNNGTEWLRLSTADIPVGNIKYSVQTTDHNGWYLLNGRAISSFPPVAQSNAAAIGFTANIPNATDKYLKAKTGAEVLGSSGGSTTFTLVQANLPAVTFYGMALSTGNHAHTYTDRGNTTVDAGVNTTVNMQADDTSGTYTTDPAGNHSHSFTVNTGGAGVPVSINPKNIALNVFIYLGQ
ncbi:hypothetical protein ACQWU4_14880 [Chryseobacterium sp. MIQD13]|uniref:hypothetical protein n=1 Tax=Chryseobacterium sp. MIQD13 TaxID=3422310 RepID=UPI003D2B2F32